VPGGCGVRAEKHQQHRQGLCFVVFGASWCVEVGTGCGRGVAEVAGVQKDVSWSALVCLVLAVFVRRSISSIIGSCACFLVRPGTMRLALVAVAVVAAVAAALAVVVKKVDRHWCAWCLRCSEERASAASAVVV
jgi:hypothetical protein